MCNPRIILYTCGYFKPTIEKSQCVHRKTLQGYNTIPTDGKSLKRYQALQKISLAGHTKPDYLEWVGRCDECEEEEEVIRSREKEEAEEVLGFSDVSEEEMVDENREGGGEGVAEGRG